MSMVYFLIVIDIIIVSILKKKNYSTSNNLIKRIKLHQFLKIETKFRLKYIRE